MASHLRIRRAFARLQGAACLVLLGTITACFPPMMHGPRVHDGLSGTLTAGVASGPTHTEGDYGGFRLRTPPVGGGVTYGWRASTPDRPSFSAALHVPALLLVPIAQVDLYAQAPEAWTGRVAAGVGTVVSIQDATHYLQAGVVDSLGRGWSVFQGVSIRHGADQARVAYVPGIAAHIGSGRPMLHLFVMGAYGRLSDPCTSTDGCPGNEQRALMVGATIEVRRRP